MIFLVKKFLIILFLFFTIFSFSNEITDALEESNKLLIKANNTIDKKDEEIKALKDKIEYLEKEIIKKDDILNIVKQTLEENNIILQEAYDRIDKDQNEISDLRNIIKKLIDSGIEITTYHWNIIFTSGYPMNIGMGIAYNLHFFPKLGLIVNFTYNWETEKPLLTAGIKINLE
jgi:uncharacterized membrane protein YgaE (UPF0421/DUF939 family)